MDCSQTEQDMVTEDRENSPIVETTSSSENVFPKDLMLDRVAKSDGFFKSQQRGDPDLTYDEKLDIVKHLLQEKPSNFLSKYGKFLQQEDLDYFQPLSSDYTIKFYLQEIEKRLQDKNQTVVKNRRFEAMKVMMAEGSYFTDEEMRYRDPFLFKQMVGQYMTEEEKKEEFDANEMTFSGFLMQQVQHMRNDFVCKVQKDIEDCHMEEEEEEEEEDANDEDSDMDELNDEVRNYAEPKSKISAEEKQQLKEEFLHIMQHRFLSGEDKNINYGDIDENVEYDSIAIRDVDEEEHYFDEEDPRDLPSQSDPDASSQRLGSHLEDGDIDYEKYDLDEDSKKQMTSLESQVNSVNLSSDRKELSPPLTSTVDPT